MDIDHVFIRASRAAPEADLLHAAGFTEGSGNRHPGQGTANRRFFFRNAFVELLWVDDETEAAGPATRRTQLKERLGGTDDGVSPFGICFRPGIGAASAPFPVWDYTPAYLPPGMAIGIGDHVPLQEPLWFYFERGQAPQGQPLDHANGACSITRVTVTLPHAQPLSDAARAAAQTGLVELIDGAQHAMEIEFDGGASGRRLDFRPALPLIVRF